MNINRTTLFTGEGCQEEIIVIDEEPEEILYETDKTQKCLKCLKEICFPGKEDEEKKKGKKPLPHWLIYVAYFFVFLSSATSAFFVILYGFTFGKEKSDKWIVSMLVSFWQSVLVIQPVKVDINFFIVESKVASHEKYAKRKSF